jgi:hypothetical protein
LARPLGVALLACVEVGEHPCRIFVFFVKLLGLLGFHTCHDASVLGNVSPYVRASQRVDIPGRIIDRVQHDHTAPVADPDLDQGAAASVRMVMPDIPQTRHADDRVTNLTGVKPVFGR